MITPVLNALDELIAVRRDPVFWNSLAYHEMGSDEQGTIDANWLERYRFLIALQYRNDADDEDLND